MPPNHSRPFNADGTPRRQPGTRPGLLPGGTKRQRQHAARLARRCSECDEPIPAAEWGRPGRGPLTCSQLHKDARQRRLQDGSPAQFGTRAFRLAAIEATPYCEACGSRDRAGLRVDHDHVTGQFRGILCAGCNRAAGDVGDQAADAWKLRALADYLEARAA